jgi:sodium/bile acid cotransporter 3/5
VAALISLAYVNMGCALDLEVLKSVVRRPIGPAIGFVSQVQKSLLRGICSGAILFVQ